MGSRQLYTCEFEIFGKVQHVFFRKHAERKAKDLGLHGWIMNTSDGSVKGVIEGTQLELDEMKHWLSTKGSPKSIIEGSTFSMSRPINLYTFKKFEMKK